VVSQAWAWGQALAEPAAAARTIVPLRTWTAASWTAVIRLIVVVITQTEEPHEPQDQQADVENAKPDHEDPTLGTDDSMLTPAASRRKVEAFYFFFGAVVGLGSAM
jgi:hypothetical protein